MDAKWYKAYVGMATDDKFKKIRKRVGIKHYAIFKMWIVSLERACKDGGWLRQSDGIAHDKESLEIMFEEMVEDYGESIIDLFFQETITERLIEKDVLGFYYIKNWEIHQHAALSTPRVQEHRENKQLEKDIDDVLIEMNKVTGKSYRLKTDGHRRHIRGRFADGHTKEEMFAVIRFKHADWKDDPKMSKFITPETLFRSSNFDRYLNEIPKGQAKEVASGETLNVIDIYGNKSTITQSQYDKAEENFYTILK